MMPCFSGGVTKFAAKESTVKKWVLNRPFQAKFVEALDEISGTSKTMANPRKCLRPSEIIKSNEMVENIMTSLTMQFLNPFRDDLDKEKLYNLVSGAPVENEISESLLSLEESGKEMMKAFEARLIENQPEEQFFSPIRRLKGKTFGDAMVKKTLKKDGKIKEVSFQRDILGKLVAYSNRQNAGVDIDKVL